MNLSRRQFLKSSAFTVGSIGLGGCRNSIKLSDKNTDKKPPNVIIIFTDDQGYGDLGCYGHPAIRTPYIDQMAAEGLRFTDFYSASAVCSPSRAALLTGRYPIRSGVTGVLLPDTKGGLPQSEITISKLLQNNGYATAHIGKWHLGVDEGKRPNDHGFDYYYGLPFSNDMNLRPGIDIAARRHQCPPKDGWDVPLMRNFEVIERPADQATLTRRYTEEAIKFIRQNKKQPFFIYLAHTMPHIPLFRSGQFKDTSIRGLYGDVIEELDWNTGKIFETLKKEQVDDNTLVIFTSDNGPWKSALEQGGSSGPLYGGKFTTWEGGMRLPAIFRMPGKIQPGVTSQVASTMDILPTITSIAGIDVPEHIILDGIDISRLLFDKQPLPKRPFFYYRGKEIFACRLGKWKAHFITQGGGGTEGERKQHNPPLLYDLHQDPSERFNRADKNPEIISTITLAVERQKSSTKIP